MPLDTFICGQCQDTFTDLNEFVNHKQGNCPANQVAPLAPSTSTTQSTEVIHLHMNESGEITGMSSLPVGEDDSLANSSTFAFLNDVNMEGEFNNQSLERNNGHSNDNSAQTLIILNSSEGTGLNSLDSSNVNQLNSNPNVERLITKVKDEGVEGNTVSKEDKTGVKITITEVKDLTPGFLDRFAGLEADKTGLFPLKKRKPRAKNGEGKNKTMEAVPPSTPRPAVPETGTDGKLLCPGCKRTFTKERHFNTHKCLASSSYVDITKKEIVKIDSGDEGQDDLDAGAYEEEEEFTAPYLESAEREEEADEEEMDKEEVPVLKKKGKRGRKRKLLADSELNQHDKETGAQTLKAAAEAVDNLPVFKNDKDKEEFEACVDIDLSEQVGNMFRIHIIEQELNELSGMVYNTPTMSSLSVYSCNVCDKVFKSLSHIRLHCITHTDLKPFQCSKCTYSTNSKGNLYTHMRKHTGQFYRCDQCDFKSVNKSHLIEHQMTHDSRRSQCFICRKDYSTLKSLINHVRKYHMDKEGKEYLQTFLQGRTVRGTTIIHQCHVCNRKFKKRIDRDRHLFIHDIKDLPHALQCELCDYWSSRKIYLDKHYQKHRVIYCCVLCDEKCLSSIKLERHITEVHVGEIHISQVGDQHVSNTLVQNVGLDNSTQLMEGEHETVIRALMEQSICKSVYLPEPKTKDKDGSLVRLYVNLPPELQASDTAASGAATINRDDTINGDDAINGGDAINGDDAINRDDAINGDDADTPAAVNSNEDSIPSSYTTNSASASHVTEPGSHSHSGFDEVSAKENTRTNDIQITSGDFPLELSIKSEMETKESSNDLAKKEIKTEIKGQYKTAQVQVTGEAKQLSGELDILSGEPELLNEGPGVLNEESKMINEEHVMLSEEPVGLMLQNPGSDSDTGEDDRVLGEGDLDEEDSKMLQDDGVEADLEDDEEGKLLFDDISAVHQPESKEAISSEKSKNEDIDMPENDCAERLPEPGDGKGEKLEAVIKRMGYRSMSMDVFTKMRATFGTEECEFCGRLFYSKLDYEPHMRTHTGDKPFACSHCSFRAGSKDSLKRHSEREHEKIAFQCKECDFLAPTRTRLWNHQLKHLGISGLSCPRCPAKFEGMKQLRVHILNEHKDIDKETLEKLTGYRHRPLGRMGRRSFKCPHCPKTFIRANSDLQKHIWIHEGIKPFACPICPYACRSKNNLQAHMLRHSTEKPFSCPECGKEYKSKTALRWHVRSHKTGKMFKCDKCPYEATQMSHLKRHVETHEVMKRFICKHCEFSANTLGYMKIHYARHHKGLPFLHEEASEPLVLPQTQKKVFKCLSCGYLFGNMSDLKRHLKIRHLVQMQAIAGMDHMQISEVEVVHYNDANVPIQGGSVSDNVKLQKPPQLMSAQTMQPIQVEPVKVSGNPGSNSTVSSTNVMQQLLGMSMNKIPTGEHQVSVVSETGEPLELPPETIIVQQPDGQLLLTSEGGGAMQAGAQYVIQYYNPEATPDSQNQNLTNSPYLQAGTNSHIQFVTPQSDQTPKLQFINPQSESQFIINPGQILSSDSPQPVESDAHATIYSSNTGVTSFSADTQSQFFPQSGSQNQAQLLSLAEQNNGSHILNHQNQKSISVLSVDGQSTQILAASSLTDMADSKDQIIYQDGRSEDLSERSHIDEANNTSIVFEGT